MEPSVLEKTSPADGEEYRVAREKWEQKIAARFESRPQFLIPILQFMQSEEGYLRPEAMQAAARYLHIPESKVYGVASFYAQFYFEPRGKNTLTVCRGTACHVRGSGRLLSEMENLLQIKPGQTTDDLSFSLETVACFGACALAPVVVINEQVHRQQTPASLKKLVQDTRPKTAARRRKRKPAKAKPRGKK